DGTSGAWRDEPVKALAAAIVLEAIGGPAVNLVHEIASRFSAARAGQYMKRELTSDLRATIFPDFEQQMKAFVRETNSRLSSIGGSYMQALGDALTQSRDALLGSIERALNAEARGETEVVQSELRDRREALEGALAEARAIVSAFLAREDEIAPPDPGDETVRRAHVEAAFDREAYARGLRPERWRVGVLGALRRGKSSLINAFAGRKILADETAGAIAYPVHVRYGDEESAFALEPSGDWREIEIETALEEATSNPVLILTPWSLPRELVLVHAPAFDAGGKSGDDVSIVAAREASEVLALFSRQLSDRELDLYARVAEMGKPMLFVHTLADNETPSERRHVVELAADYLRQRGIAAQRIFTISTLEYARAKREHRAPAPWNELDALISTVVAHAEEHMTRLERIRRAAATATGSPLSPRPSQAARRSLFSRLFKR
ncbi:MAG: dynamin family protein, partial [Candidatus Eremiobacteraeota bacterium]|nr:dynamin family protein [Candidatus Eremiobacteraeota bacterium]